MDSEFGAVKHGAEVTHLGADVVGWTVHVVQRGGWCGRNLGTVRRSPRARAGARVHACRVCVCACCLHVSGCLHTCEDHVPCVLRKALALIAWEACMCVHACDDARPLSPSIACALASRSTAPSPATSSQAQPCQQHIRRLLPRLLLRLWTLALRSMAPCYLGDMVRGAELGVHFLKSF
jgi:hypothetical protein